MVFTSFLMTRPALDMMMAVNGKVYEWDVGEAPTKGTEDALKSTARLMLPGRAVRDRFGVLPWGRLMKSLSGLFGLAVRGHYKEVMNHNASWICGDIDRGTWGKLENPFSFYLGIPEFGTSLNVDKTCSDLNLAGNSTEMAWYTTPPRLRSPPRLKYLLATM